VKEGFPVLRMEAERRRRRWTQAEVARRTGIHPTAVWHLENRTMYPWPKWRRLLAEVLGVGEAELFDEVAGIEGAAVDAGEAKRAR
jgi:transcriptional regulator with XRE-family HTH domain